MEMSTNPMILGSFFLSQSSIIRTIQLPHLNKPAFQRTPSGSDVTWIRGSASKALPSSYCPSGSTRWEKLGKAGRDGEVVHVLNYVITHYFMHTHAGEGVSGQLHAPAALPSGEIVPGAHSIGGCTVPINGIDAVNESEVFCFSAGNQIIFT
jgi:hypothetical protein